MLYAGVCQPTTTHASLQCIVNSCFRLAAMHTSTDCKEKQRRRWRAGSCLGVYATGIQVNTGMMVHTALQGVVQGSCEEPSRVEGPVLANQQQRARHCIVTIRVATLWSPLLPPHHRPGPRRLQHQHRPPLPLLLELLLELAVPSVAGQQCCPPQPARCHQPAG